MSASATAGPSPAESLAQPPAGTPPSPEDELRRRVVYLMLFRLVLISLVLGSTLLLSYLSDVDLSSAASLLLFGIIGTTYLLTLIYALVITRIDDPRQLADFQLAADLVITTLLVHVTGGVQSAYSFFFPLSIIGAATVRFRRGAVLVAAASIALFLAVSYLGWLEVLPSPSGQRLLPSDPSRLELMRSMALNIAAFLGVGFLAYSLGAQIQRTSATLETQRTAAADLFVLHEDIVRSLASGLITTDAHDRVSTMNEAASEILGAPARDAVGRPVDDVVGGLGGLLAGVPAHGSLRRADLLTRGGDGDELALGISVSPLRDNEDRTRGRVINFQDLTELRRMEEQIKRAERLAMVGTLAAGIAHEIRNPLASISGSIELLRSSPQTDDEGRALMEIVTREVDRLNVLITDLLEYSNPSPVKAVDFDLADMVAETVQVFRQDPNLQELDVELELLSQTRDLSVHADPAKLRQVLWNLLRNAAEAAEAGGRHVSVQLRTTDEHVAIEVADDGAGIAPDDQDKIFDPFFTTKSHGSGLGLATCHNIIDEHGGTIEVSSEPGKGSRFVVTLPLGGDEPQA